MPKTRMQILLDPEAKKMLEREASARKISVGQVIREAVELYGKERWGMKRN
jgi:Ribbon-helix-helix protein, copG family